MRISLARLMQVRNSRHQAASRQQTQSVAGGGGRKVSRRPEISPEAAQFPDVLKLGSLGAIGLACRSAVLVARCTCHSHPSYLSYVVSGGQAQIQDEKGVRKVNVVAGALADVPPTPWHELTNVGDTRSNLSSWRRSIRQGRKSINHHARNDNGDARLNSWRTRSL